ncbi:MAG: hypothetical protein E6J90_13245 [Deltaproteobacteria bacterium]|nr:MAG: hypothetical protein E6J91_21935 [Deltaproteobacteria bacterium]TMQ21931.1 MAG: hypothetical protein E6J90_13245 [Deltaproteobacteria bacterium]
MTVKLEALTRRVLGPKSEKVQPVEKELRKDESDRRGDQGAMGSSAGTASRARRAQGEAAQRNREPSPG